MYNQEIKERYIEEKLSDTIIKRTYLESAFERCAPFEEELGKDLCNFSYYDIANYYKTINYKNIDTLYVLNSTYGLYATWCVNNNLVADSQNHFAEFDRSKLNEFVNKVIQKKQIVSRKQVLDWVGQLPNSCDQFCLLGIFEGISGNDYTDLVNARIGDIHGNKIDLHSGRTIEISDKLIEIAHDSDETLMSYSMTNDMVAKSKLIENGYIIKDYPSSKPDADDARKGRRIYFKFRRIFNFLGVSYLTANNILVSGEVDMVMHQANRYGISCYDYVMSDNLNEINTQYGKNIVRSYFWSNYKNIFENGHEETE